MEEHSFFRFSGGIFPKDLLLRIRQKWQGKQKFRQIVLLLLILVVLAGALLHPDFFFTEQDVNRFFIPDNYSSSITAQRPLTVEFRAPHRQLTKIGLQFVPNSERCANTSLTVSLVDDSGQALLQKELSAEAVHTLRDNYVLETDLRLDRGKTYRLVISTDETDEEACYRTAMGEDTYDRSIVAWYAGDAEEPGRPNVHFTYVIGSTYTLLFVFCLLGAAAAVLLPSFKKPVLNWALHWSFLIGAPLLILYTIQLLSLRSIPLLSLWAIFWNLVLIAVILFALYAFTNRLWISFALGGGALLVLAAVNYFVVLFRKTPLGVSDFYGATTAAAVMGSYQLAFSPSLLMACAVFVFLLCLGFWDETRISGWKTRAALVLVACVGLGGLFKFCASERLYARGEFQRVPFSRVDQYKNCGFLMGFALDLPYLRAKAPEGYSAEKVASIAPSGDSAPAQGQPYPDILLIMNESFADLSVTGNLSVDKDPLPYLHTLAQDDRANTYVGQLVVPVYGGGTSCSEFEALTGFSLAFCNSSGAPYSQFVRGTTPSLAESLAQLGYSTLAMHPNEAKNWDRDRVYPLLGFQNTYFLDQPYMNSYIVRGGMTSDRDDYATMQTLADDMSAPRFIFNVTMQNHGGYADPYAPDHIRIIGGRSDYAASQQYLSLLYESDRAFEELTQFYDQVERPTLIVMFGDHWGSVDDDYLTDLFGLPSDQLTPQQELPRYTTPVVMYANYDLDLSALPARMSANYLSPFIKSAAGLPLTGQDRYLLELHKEFPVISQHGILDAAGTFYSDLPSGDAGLRLSEYEELQYNGLIDRKHRREEVFSYS